MTKTGYNDKIVKNLLTFTIYIPLVAVALYSCLKIYDWVNYPTVDSQTPNDPAKTTEDNINEYFKDTVWTAILDMFSSMQGYAGWIFDILKLWFLNFKTLAITGFIIYIIISFYFTYTYKNNPTFEKWSTYTNIIMILLCAFLGLGVLSLFIKENFVPETNFEDLTFLNKIKWTFFETVPVYKTAVGMSVLLAMSILFLFLIGKFEFLKLTSTTIIELIAGMGLIFTLYRYVSSNPKWMSIMSGSILLKIIYHLIFIIPCSVIYLTDHLWGQLKNTPYVTWIILLVEILTIGLYFIIPLIKKYIFIHSVTKKDDLMLHQESLGNKILLQSCWILY